MNYLDLLRKSSKRSGSIACMGMDPVIESIPLDGDIEEIISKFYINILLRMQKEGIFPACVKPNMAFFEQYGFKGLKALNHILAEYRASEIPVILDAKRGDIGKTSLAYAQAVFDFWEADAVTVAPYMGSDSVSPFIDYCGRGKGVYILTRTSNKGAGDLQDYMDSSGTALYEHTASKILEWHKPGLGSVVGATYPDELKKILKRFREFTCEIPLLIPGVGSQGASAAETFAILKEHSEDVTVHRINSSSAINYAYEKTGSKDYAACAVEALAKLMEETRI